MTGVTPHYSLPYPTTSDDLTAALTTIPEDLALAVESTLIAFGGIAAAGVWTALPFVSGYANAGGSFVSCAYSKAGAFVELRGTMLKSSGTISANTTVANLPAGFRPLSGTRRFGVVIGTAAGIVDVLTTGAVVIQSAVASGAGISLDPIRFRID